MIHFDFVVSDVDAMNIFSILRNQIGRNNLGMQKAIKENDSEMLNALEQDNQYVNDLISQMKNTHHSEIVQTGSSFFERCSGQKEENAA